MFFKRIVVLALLAVAVAALVTAEDSSAQGDKTPFPAYGSGAIDVRLYSDYFCPPCQKLEPSLEPILKDLLKRNIIRLTLVDFPMHEESPLYTRYFLYALKSRNDAEHGLHVRNVLFKAAAGKDFLTAKKIEELFRNNKIPYVAFDPKPIFVRFNTMLAEDRVNQTPTCVIIKSVKREQFVGGEDILKALKDLK
jgi:thiol:disulfide interchange protein DsbA